MSKDEMELYGALQEEKQWHKETARAYSYVAKHMEAYDAILDNILEAFNANKYDRALLLKIESALRIYALYKKDFKEDKLITTNHE